MTIQAQVTDAAVGAVSFVIAIAPLTTTTTVIQGPAQAGATDIHHPEQSKPLEEKSTAGITSTGTRDTVSALATVSDAMTVDATSAKKTSTIPGATHTVQVGIHNQTLFRPNQLDAAVGDIIVFNFHRSNHTVSESTLDKPCTASEGFDTGFHQGYTNDTRMPFVAFSVENSAPRWFFCQQDVVQSHCHDGMVFGLNPGEKMNDFLQNAQNQAESYPCVLNASSNCVEPPSNESMNWNKTGDIGTLGRLPTGPAVVPSRLTSRAGRNYKRGAGSLYMLGAAGMGVL